MTRAFERFAGWSAVLAALAGFVFTVAFAVVVEEEERWAEWVSWTALTLGGLVTLPVMAALYYLLRGVEPEFALVGFVSGLAGALGAAIHGAFELSVLANPPDPGGPSAVDPRGFATFVLTGLAFVVFGWLGLRTGRLPAIAARLALAAAVLLVVVYVARLTVLDPKTNVIRAAALASGLAVIPAFYLLLARSLLRDANSA
ncbi:MAG: hypothetical protein ACRDZ1_05695 [Acidimicrobiia bacterium]